MIVVIAVIAQTFCKEAVTWKALRHPNVLPLLGVTMGEKLFAMVSEWMVNGNINEFIKTYRNTNRFELVRLHSHHWSHLSLMKLLLTARRRHPGITVYTWRGDDPWGPEGGTNSSAGFYSTT